MFIGNFHPFIYMVSRSFFVNEELCLLFIHSCTTAFSIFISSHSCNFDEFPAETYTFSWMNLDICSNNGSTFKYMLGFSFWALLVDLWRDVGGFVVLLVIFGFCGVFASARDEETFHSKS